MKKITALRTGTGRRKQVNIYLDGKFALSLEAEVATREGLRTEQVLSANEIEALTRLNLSQRCLKAAVHYLSYRPRSESELRGRLHQRGFAGDNIEEVVTRLKEQGLIDDAAFARFWKENRESFSPRSQRLTRLELRQKGVANDIIDDAVESIDEDDCAYRAGQRKASSLSRADYQSFRLRLGEYLKRRGFGYEVINHATERLWQDQGSNPE